MALTATAYSIAAGLYEYTSLLPCDVKGFFYLLVPLQLFKANFINPMYKPVLYNTNAISKVPLQGVDTVGEGLVLSRFCGRTQGQPLHCLQ